MVWRKDDKASVCWFLQEGHSGCRRGHWRWYYICNAVHNSSFWSVSIAQILTLIIAVGVAFFATQYKADERKQKEHAENIVLKIQAAVSDDHFVHISCEDNPKDITINNRKINNAIDLLKQYAAIGGRQRPLVRR